VFPINQSTNQTFIHPIIQSFTQNNHSFLCVCFFWLRFTAL